MANKQSNFVMVEYSILRDKNFNSNEKLVYAYLKGFTKAGLSAFPSLQTIADDLGIAKRTVQNALDKLEKNGMLSRQQRFNNSSVYDVNEWKLPIAEIATPIANIATLGVQELPPNISMNISLIKSIKEVVEDIKDDRPLNAFSFPCTSSKVKLSSPHNQGWSIDDLEEEPF